ncbi:MAG: hypothetical protein AAF298_00205 [Cyanobacteria bacterium P01_A01_bin.40]
MANFSEQDIRGIVIDELRKFFGGFLGISSQADIHYLNTNDAAKEFGYGTNTRPLYHLIETGVLRQGKEYQDRRPAGSKKAVYYFNKQACLKRFDTPPEKRAS